jgi:diacylglycerol kinase family enzyme
MWHWNETRIPYSQVLVIEMRYAIITNPVSGKISPDEKRSVLAEAAEILNADIYGLETATREEFGQCARELASRCDILVAAGGDGTLSDVINSIDPVHTAVAYLPLGSGNSMAYALGYKGSLADTAMRIKRGGIYEYDLINCDDKRRAFMSSVGLEGTILRLRDQYLAQGARGFRVYFRAVLRSYFIEYRRIIAEVNMDESTFTVDKLLTLLVFKQPYYGYGFKVIPRARFDDGKLHVLCVNSGLFGCLLGAVTAFTAGNLVGKYCSCRQVQVKLERPLLLQVDGNRGWEADSFTFKVLPKALRIKF